MFSSDLSEMWEIFDATPVVQGLHALSITMQIFLIFSLTWLLGMYTYNVYFHPLRNYPGPTSTAASYLPWLYYRLTGNSRHWHQSLHDRYGHVVRTGPAFLSFTDAQAWKDIYGHRSASHQTNAKDWHFYAKPLKPGQYSISNTPTDELHGKVRRMFAGAFSDRALKLQEPLVFRHIDKLAHNMYKIVSEEPSASIDLVQMYTSATIDIMSDLAFGQAVGMLDDHKSTFWLQIVYGNVKATNLLVVTQFYRLFRPFTRFLISRTDINSRQEQFKRSAELLDGRLARGRDEPDIWNLVEAKNEGLLTHGQIHANAAVFMSGGTETTATLLCGVTYLLLKHPKKLERLVSEVRSFPHATNLSLEQLARLPYLNACIREALRLYPPIAEGLPRRIGCDSGPVLGNYLAPGTSVYVSPYVTYRSPRNFEDSNLFKPERWLPESPYKNDCHDALQPFSTGPRNCIGKNLAYHEMRLSLARVLYDFDLLLEHPAQQWLDDQKTYILWEKTPLLVKAKPISNSYNN